MTTRLLALRDVTATALPRSAACIARRSGSGWVTRASHRPALNGVEVSHRPREHHPTWYPNPSVHETPCHLGPRDQRPRRQDDDGPHHDARGENQRGERDHDDAGPGNETNSGGRERGNLK